VRLPGQDLGDSLPTLLLAGELDPISPVEEIEDTASRMRPGLARVVRFPDAGHGVGGQPTAIDLVRDFVVGDACRL
jgi:pimeloyl-ACP methyl ester carboxylesterase